MGRSDKTRRRGYNAIIQPENIQQCQLHLSVIRRGVLHHIAGNRRDSAALVAGKIREAIRTRTGITASFGVGVFDPRMPGPGNMVESADRALYNAKKSGRNRVEICPWP